MQRTEYWNQTRPTDTQLNWTETSKTSAINQRLRSSAQMGIAWGFQVTVNSVDNTKIDVARGEGYSGGEFLINEFETAGSGQRISTYTDTPSGTDDTGPAATSQGLADYTAGVLNYVSLVYSETESHPLSERSYPFTNRQTVVTETFTVSVLTETQWNALDAEALNNRILVGIVTAQGAGTPITSANIEQFVQPKTLPSSSQPSTISGVTIVGISDVTPLGIGTLRWEPSTSSMYWTAPGDTEGTALTISDSGVFTIYSNNTNYTLSLNVVWGSLSLVAAETSENISIRSLYGREIPMFSATDQIHRDMVGSGQPSTTNPHALTLADIGGGTLDHADLFHVNGISKDADSTQLECQIDAINDRIQVTSLGGFENSFLVDGVTLTEASGSNYVNFDTAPAPDSGEYLIYVDSAGNLGKVQIGNAFTNFTNLDIWDISNIVAGTGEIEWDATNDRIRYKAPGDAVWGDWVYVADRAPPLTGNGGFYKVYSSTTANWIILEFSGIIGASNTETFTVVKDETSYSDESMLKLSVVHWDQPTEVLSNLRDIRRFVTADNRTEFEEEHDENGHHTKTLRNGLDIYNREANTLLDVYGESVVVRGRAVSHTAGYFSAESTMGLEAHASDSLGAKIHAPNFGLYASAATETAIYATAPNTVVTVLAGTDTAIRASAVGNIAGAFIADNIRAVYGSAANEACYFYAETDTAIRGNANGDTAIMGTAANTAVFGRAETRYAAYFSAPNTALYATAATEVAVSGLADSNAIRGTAADSFGVAGLAGVKVAVWGSAPNTAASFFANTATAIEANADRLAIYATVTDSQGIYVTAPNTAAQFTVETNTAVDAGALGETAVRAVASATAIWVSATNEGIRVTAAGATAIYATAGAAYGVAAQANQLAGWFNASSDYSGNEVLGLYGAATNAAAGHEESAIGVSGWVVGSLATAVHGSAAHASYGTGVLGEAGSGNIGVGAYGVFGSAGVAGIGLAGVAGIMGASLSISAANAVGLRIVADTAVNGTGMQVFASSLFAEISAPTQDGHTDSAEEIKVTFNGAARWIRLYT